MHVIHLLLKGIAPESISVLLINLQVMFYTHQDFNLMLVSDIGNLGTYRGNNLVKMGEGILHPLGRCRILLNSLGLRKFGRIDGV